MDEWWELSFDADEFEKETGRKPVRWADLHPSESWTPLDIEKILRGDIAGEICECCAEPFAPPLDVIIAKCWWGIDDPPAYFFIFHQECWYDNAADGSDIDWDDCVYYHLYESNPKPEPCVSRTRFRTVSETRTLAYHEEGSTDTMPQYIVVTRDEQGMVTYGSLGRKVFMTICSDTTDAFEQDVLAYLGWR